MKGKADHLACCPAIFDFALYDISLIIVPYVSFSIRSKKTVSLRSGEKFPLPDVVVIQQENISDFLDQCMECIAVCPSVVTINLPRDKALTKSVSTVAPTSDSCFKHIAGTETTLQLILEKLLAHLLPTAIYDQVKSNLCGTSPIVLLCGKHGSGKSLICRQVSQLLSNCPRTLTEVVRVNCAQLSLSPLEDVLEKLNNTFQGNFGKTRTPRLAVLDDLDYLCPGISSDAIVSGRGTIADERSMIIALHLQRLLQDISTRHRESISAAKNLFTESEVGATEDKGSRNSKSKYCNFFELYLEDRIVAKVLSSVTAVLITSNTVDSLPTSLFSTSLIDCAVSVQSLLPKTRLELLPKLLLQHYRIDFAVETLSARQQHLLIDQTEGMLIADILSVVRQFALKNYQLIDNAVVDTSGYPESEVVVVKAGVHEASSVEEKDYNPREQGIFEALIQLLRAKGLRTVNSKTKAHATKDSNLTFKDIGGYDDVKRSILQIIRMPAIYQRLYNFSPVRRQRAILLYG